MTRPHGRMDAALVRRLIAEAYELGTREIAFYAGSEPFMSPNLEENIKLAKELGYTYIFITTNGSIATEERLKACVDNGLDSIKFSINGGDRETYKRIHGKDHFDRVIANVKFVSEYRKTANRKLYMGVSFVMIDHEAGSNAGTKEHLKELVDPYVDEIIFYEANMSHGQMFGLAPMEIEPPCPLPFERLHISSEGYLRMCCSDYQNYLSLVDLNTTNLHDAWYSDIYKGMRRRHLDGKLEGTLCHNCLHNTNEPMEPIVPAFAVKVEQAFFQLKPSSKS
jgi:organic radical activating enzyme